ncbi:MAG: T9SS type A sorting domain-containing protein [Bacteroidetes bacterium]|nr:T9SS type A sorting domain-containing protein [Bacteroidota bacterium]
MQKNLLLIFLLSLFISATFLVARSFRAPQIPNGTLKSCANCHVNPGGGGTRNPFGQEIEANHLSAPGAAGQVQWSPALAALDSDGDGFSNGVELQDPEGSWQIGQPFPGDPALVTNPGDPTDFPNTTSVELLPGTARHFILEGNYPNPFNPVTTIRFEIPERCGVQLEIFNAQGARVRTLADDSMDAGVYEVRWNGRDDTGRPVESGVYLYHLRAGKVSSMRRMVLLK